MTEDIVVVGAGGFGRETLDVIEAINRAEGTRWRVLGVLDDAPSEINVERLARRDLAVLGPTSGLSRGDTGVRYVVGIGAPAARRRLADQLDQAGWRPATLIHPAATLGFDVRVGEGSVVCAGVRLTTNIGLGRHVHLNPNATVGHDTELGDFVSLNPAASVSGDCVIGAGTLIGVGAVVLNGLTVGADVVVGGAACVVSDVADGRVVKGVPAR